MVTRSAKLDCVSHSSGTAGRLGDRSPLSSEIVEEASRPVEGLRGQVFRRLDGGRRGPLRQRMEARYPRDRDGEAMGLWVMLGLLAWLAAILIQRVFAL